MSLPNHIDVRAYMLPKGGMPMRSLSTVLNRYPDYAPELCNFAFSKLLPMQRIVFIYLFKQLIDGTFVDDSCAAEALSLGRITRSDIRAALTGLKKKGYVCSRGTGGNIFLVLNDTNCNRWLNYFKERYTTVWEDVAEQDKPMIIDPIGVIVRR